MLSGVVSAGYSGYWTWKAGPGNKGLRSSSVVADEDVFRRLRVDGDPMVRGCCVVAFAGYVTLLHYENNLTCVCTLERPRWRSTAPV